MSKQLSLFNFDLVRGPRPLRVSHHGASSSSSSLSGPGLTEAHMVSQSHIISDTSDSSHSSAHTSPSITISATTPSPSTISSATAPSPSTTSTSSATAPSDIANSTHNGPIQPQNHTFPSTFTNNRLRSFNPLWFDTYRWLEYSIERNAAYCYACRFFSTGHHQSEAPFVTTGFTNWKNAPGRNGRLEKHDKSERHQHAMSAWSDYTSNTTNKSQKRSIASILNLERQEQIQRNRHYMKTVLNILKFCSFQEIALRGHREVESAANKGNFLELLDLVSEHDQVVKARLRDGPRNATYTSHNIQDELIHILAKNVRLHICNKVREAGYYSIIVDESRDLAKQEQISFVVRYFDINDRQVHEHFLAFHQAKFLDAFHLSEYIRELITGFDFDVNKLVSQGYDGASVMSGHCTGVQTRVRAFAPYAVYIHCHAHILNLVLVDSVRSVQSASEFFVLLEALYVFISTSKVHVIFIEKQRHLRPGKQPLELHRLSDTRWVCRYAAVNVVSRTFDSILLTVEEVAESQDASKAIEARGLYHQLHSFSFLISLITFDRILTCTKQLSDKLQCSSIDLSLASELILATKSLLTEYRTTAYWNKLYEYAVEVAKLHDITIDSHSQRGTLGRRRKRPSRLEESVVLETVGSRDSVSTSEEIRCHFYFPILDKFLAELSNRFDEKNVVIMDGVSSCTPTSSTFLSFNYLKAFGEEYGIGTETLEVECQLLKIHFSQFRPDITSLADLGSYLLMRLPAHRTICELVRIALTIAVTSVESERSFSTMKRIKSRLRTRMTEDRLADLSILSIEKEVAQELKDDSIIDEFAATDKNRRIVLF